MTISCGLCWNIDSRKIIWPPWAHFGSENESLKGLRAERLWRHLAVACLVVWFPQAQLFDIVKYEMSLQVVDIRLNINDFNERKNDNRWCSVTVDLLYPPGMSPILCHKQPLVIVPCSLPDVCSHISQVVWMDGVVTLTNKWGKAPPCVHTTAFTEDSHG